MKIKKKRITYGVPGMMEFEAAIKVGKGVIKVHFTDGFMSSRGECPATFTTDNIMVQNAIEASPAFRRGQIKRIKAYELAEDVPVLTGTNRGETAQEDGEASADRPSCDDEPETGYVTPDNTPETTLDETPAPAPAEEASTAELKKVEVTCNDEARDYLEANCGVQRSKLRTRADIVAAAGLNGVEFVFSK